jgi:hypothetical protein
MPTKLNKQSFFFFGYHHDCQAKLDYAHQAKLDCQGKLDYQMKLDYQAKLDHQAKLNQRASRRASSQT